MNLELDLDDIRTILLILQDAEHEDAKRIENDIVNQVWTLYQSK